MKRSLLPLLLLFTFTSLPARAIENEEVSGRLESIERNLMLLQRQVARTPADEDAPTGDVPAGAAGTEVRITALEEEIRKVRGQLEESQFQNRRNAEAVERLQKDIEFRFQQLQQAAPAAPATEQPVSERKAIPSDEEASNEVTTESVKEAKKEAAAKTKPDVKVKEVTEEKPAAENGPMTSFENPREHYNYAFKLLNQTNYDESEASFKSFLKKYPKDPLAGNAQYWLGEIHYMNHDFVTAADNFRQGFEVSTTGPKAPDNLLKLAMSLSALKHDKEACVVLKQVGNKFGKSNANATRKAANEQKRIGCPQ